MNHKIAEGVSRTSLTARVYDEIEEAILSGELAPGENLTEMKLSAELGVSRTPIREALSQLEREGLVRSVPNKGAVVVGISRKDIQDIYSIRSAIEGLAARWAAQNIRDDELAELRDVVELQEYYAQKGEIQQIRQLDSRFHEMIYQASRSSQLQRMLSSFHHYISRERERSFMKGGRALKSVEEHRMIYEAIASRSEDEAERLTGVHIRNAWENILGNLPSE